MPYQHTYFPISAQDSSLLLSHCSTVDHELLDAIYSQQPGHDLIIKGTYGADAASDLLRRQVEVLADMPGVEMNQPISPLAVPPGHAIDVAGPDEEHRRVFDHGLSQAGVGQTFGHARIRI